jgi:lipoprotein-releasing system permease protein
VAFEHHIGWRYLYRPDRTRRSLWLALAGAVVAVGASGWFFAIGPHGMALVLLVFGALTAVLFGLLHFLSVFTTVSTLGVVLGVAALTVVMSVTSGFQRSFREKVLGVTAHILIRKSTSDFDDYREKVDLALATDPGVLSAQPIVYTEMLVTRGRGKIAGVAIKGIEPAGVNVVADHMIEGSVAELARPRVEGELRPILIGRDLAAKIDAKLGDTVTVVSPLSHLNPGRWTPTGKPPRTERFQVAGIFYVGFDEYDQRLVYLDLRDAQDLVDLGDVVLGIELRIRDVERARDIAAKVDEAFGGPPFQVQDWHELNANVFAALSLQKLAMVIVLTLIIIVAAFNLVSALTMMVTDKTREIAILKSMGATARSVGRVFRVIGLLIGAVGTLGGVALGIVLCAALQRYDYALDPNVYRIDRLPVDLNVAEVAMVVALTMLIAAVATLFPARKAAALPPVDGLRYD